MSALLSDSPSLVILQHVVTHLPLHSGLCVYALPASSVLLYDCLERTALFLLWQRSASAPSTADVMLLQPCRHTSRQADGQANRQPTSRLGVFIDSPPMHRYSKLHGHIRPEGKPVLNMLCILFCIHKSSFYMCNIYSVSLTKMQLQHQALKYWSLKVNHSLSPTSWKRCTCWNLHLPQIMNILHYTPAKNSADVSLTQCFTPLLI